METSKEAIDRCKDRRRSEVERYYQTVLLTIGLKDYLDKINIDCRFVSAEPKFLISKSRLELFPDIVLQYNNDDFGILCEIKTSLPHMNHFLLEKMKQLERYSQKVEGWDTPTKEVQDHAIVLLCHSIDSDRVVNKVSRWVSTGDLNFQKKFCIGEWGVLESLKFGERDVILIRHRFGNTGCSSFDEKLRENIKLDVDRLMTKYEKCRFTRKEPPVEYMMSQLWTCIFPAIHEKPENFETSLTEILKVTYQYYIPWSGIEGEYSQVRKRWISKAMKAFCDIFLAEEIEDQPENYEIFYGKRIEKNVHEYFIDKLCRKEIERVRKMRIEEALEEAQRRLIEF